MPNTGCGDRATYRAGCRCDACRAAETRYANVRQLAIDRGIWRPYVDAEPVRAHIEQLRAAGLGRRRIAQLAGVSDRTISGLLYGSHGKGPVARTRPETAAKILAVRARLADVHDNILIDGTGTRRRLRALTALGFTGRHLAPRMGADPTQFSRLLVRDRAVYAATARAAIRVYDELWDQDPIRLGVAPWAARRVARDAAARGWAPPLAWDDDTIDDPAARPDFGEPGRRQDAIVEDAEFVASTMRDPSADKIAERLGVSRNYLDKVHERHRAELAEAA